MWFFRSPTLVLGQDSLLHLAELRGSRAFVITDSTVRKAHLVDPVLIQLEHAGMKTQVYDRINAKSDLDSAQSGAEVMAAFDPDWIVAVGGGNVLDSAKAMWVLFENPDINLLEMSPLDPITLRESARLICIPTTAGAGGEATCSFMLNLPADVESAERTITLSHPACMPDFAITDPTMTATLSPDITADTGLEALAQAIEAFSSTWSNEVSDGLSLVAIKQLYEYLPQAHASGDMPSREKVGSAATLAGLAQANSMPGTAQAMAWSAATSLDMPHGLACTLFLSYVIEYSSNRVDHEDDVSRYSEIENYLGAPAESETGAGRSLAKRLRNLLIELGQPVSLGGMGLSRTKFDELLPMLVDNTLSDTALFTSPRQPDQEDLTKLFERAYSGESADF